MFMCAEINERWRAAAEISRGILYVAPVPCLESVLQLILFPEIFKMPLVSWFSPWIEKENECFLEFLLCAKHYIALLL